MFSSEPKQALHVKREKSLYLWPIWPSKPLGLQEVGTVDENWMQFAKAKSNVTSTSTRWLRKNKNRPNTFVAEEKT